MRLLTGSLVALIALSATSAAYADTMATASPKPSPAAMHGTMSSHHTQGHMMQSNHMHANTMHSHMMASPKPSPSSKP